ncbi:MAG: DUF5320 domain-containing protein [Thermodesulfobacteriota bacterium]
MPALDGTGPMGLGPMTGGGRGWCNPYYARVRAPMFGYPYLQHFGWGRMPYGYGFSPGFFNPYFMGFRAFPHRFLGRGRGLRRYW